MGRIVVSFQVAKPTVALARFGSFARSIDTGTPNTAAISSTISSRPCKSFGGNWSGLRSTCPVIARKRPVLFVPRSFVSTCAVKRSSSSSLALPCVTSR